MEFTGAEFSMCDIEKEILIFQVLLYATRWQMTGNLMHNKICHQREKENPFELPQILLVLCTMSSNGIFVA